MADTVMNFSISEIAQMFSDYVERMQDTERHTDAACKEVNEFDTCCSSEFPNNYRLHSLMYEKMMDCAVEFEESGFIAGFQMAVALLTGQEEISEEIIHINTNEEKQMHHEAIQKPKRASDFTDCITSLQIARLFGNRNHKVIERIEKQILPKTDNESKAYFEKIEGVNVQNKPVTFYKMNRAACQMYLDLMEPRRNTFVNIAGGYAKLKELMEKVFPSEIRAITV